MYGKTAKPTDADVYDHVVLCAGVKSAEFSKKIGDPLDIYPVKGYSITLEVGNGLEDAPMVSLLDDEAKIVTSRLGSRFRVAGTAELAGINYDIRADRIDPLVKWVRKNFPYISTEHTNPWAGLRPMTPNMLPVVRQSKVKNIWYNTGHGHLGWTLSPATAEMITELIIGG
jgi:D-amino-acid dehydrogenase